MFVHPDNSDAVEPGRVSDQDPFPLGQDGVVGGVPRDPERLGDPSDGQVLDDQAGQGPRQPGPGDLRASVGGLARVLAPHVTAAAAPVAADRHRQRGGSPPERFVRQLPDHAVPGRALTTAASTPSVILDNTARQHRPIGFDPLTGHHQPEPIEAGERRQVRASEGSVNHVEVLRIGSVRTSNLRGPRPLPSDRRAAQPYTLICDEPRNADLI